MERQTILQVSTNAFLKNINNIQSYVKDKKLMPVIKANAYGTYINKNLDLIKNFDIVAVAMVSEGIELRKIGYKNEIFVLNQPFMEDIANIEKYNLTVGVASIEFIRIISKCNYKFNVHLEIETGMGRTGIEIKELEEILSEIKTYSNIDVQGVYTHFAVADVDKEFTEKQIEIFENGVEIVKKYFPNIKYIHSSASNGLLNFESKVCNLVRPGIIMYGYEACNSTLNKIKLYPITKLKSKISFIKTIEKGTSISYGRTFVAEKEMKIATVGIGYEDGIRRELSNKGEVVINGKKASIVGTICMDSFMVDITDIDAKIGDDVFIWDNDIIKLEDVAKKCNTINYEILSTISDRVPRVFTE